ncbi:sigma-70 family RNA polymerase sigma factor [Companilactobacillus kimchiensis]|nr:sigma-70 family RNA polymerase sigma factor [Companilactobacillus kimchiensis]
MEKLWINCVKENKDSIALVNLVRRYQPMINNMRSQYYINGYDINDWYQDALLVCYQTCNVFDGNSGSKFGSFFKLKFKNYIIDNIRHENAQKRKANIGAQSLDLMPIEEQRDIGAVENCGRLVIQYQIQEIVSDFSDIELVSFQFLLGKISKKDACKKAKCDLQRIELAINRAKTKLKSRRALFDLS